MKGLASTPPFACRIQATVSPAKLAVNVTARLSPPVNTGKSIANVSNPNSGSWNATEPKVAWLKNCGDAMLKNKSTAINARKGPTISLPKRL